MSFVRWVFLLALLMLTCGIFVGQRLLGPMFAGRALSAPPNVAAAPKPTSRSISRPAATRAVVRPTVRPAAPTPSSTAAAPTVTLVPTVATTPTGRAVAPVATATVRHPAAHRPGRSKPRVAGATRLPTATATPVPTATTGLVALSRYWIGTPSARAGSLISVGYVIDNGTGHTARVMLGASVKSSRTAGWISSIADPAHDVVAIVPPGVTTHIRYFTLPPRLRAGSYDVAWGLRNAVNGARDALVFAPEALQVGR